MTHSICIDHPIVTPDDGLFLGNGDLSVSCWQSPGTIIFQLGKNNFWDTRLLLDKNPKPAHIEELRTLVMDPNFKVDGTSRKLNGDKLTDRQREICRRVPSQGYTAPMPKPGPQVHLHYPPDWRQCSIRQTLEIERGLLRIEIRHFAGGMLVLEAVVHPEENRLALHWTLSGITPENRYGGYFYGLPDMPLVYATLSREKELTREEFIRREYLDHGNRHSQNMSPLPPPQTLLQNNVLIQKIPDSMSLYTAGAIPEDGGSETFADVLCLTPSKDCSEGTFSFGVSTDSAEDAMQLAQQSNWETDLQAQTDSCDKFWNRSRVSFDSPVLEECYYAAMHGKRSLLKAGVYPPGLFFPSALKDFSLWRGDYHLNYNYQSIFMGAYESNHLEQGDAYFTGIAPLLELGEKISRDYYGIDGGCFVQLCGYPFPVEDDYFGSLPLGRMAYMTGWVAAYFYRRFLLTQDLDFLKNKAYPFLKKAAVFYTGFLQEDDQGIYHAFPSNQGECDFSYAGTMDQPQVIYHAAYALHCASQAATILHVDRELAAEWEHIRSHLPEQFSEMPKDMAPEFFNFDGKKADAKKAPDFLTPGNPSYDWYFGHMPYRFSIRLRGGIWRVAEDYQALIDYLKRWRQPNGLMRAMSVATHGYYGPWTESLAIVGSLNDMLMTSDGGIIRLFPGIPDGHSASFSTLRAEGAFLVSAIKQERVKKVDIFAECNGTCRLVNPWPQADCILEYHGETEALSGEILNIQMQAGTSCCLRQR
ncbi:MAG: hypothetical protein GX946_01030 [Oligosphaeraceae bacterium]|nr:hypothetical protein [Oligosphaeraceae bacterium]